METIYAVFKIQHEETTPSFCCAFYTREKAVAHIAKKTKRPPAQEGFGSPGDYEIWEVKPE